MTWISIWQGPEQDDIHNTEDRGGCASSKTEGEDDYRYEPRIPTDLPKRIAYILRQILKQWKSPSISIGFLGGFDAAEFQERIPPGVLWAHAGA
jgi:hypothetical protein